MSALPDVGVRPNYGMTLSGEYKRDVASFGDGYELRRPSGLQPYRREWTVTWPALTKDQHDTLRDFIDATLGCTAFDWTPSPGEDTVSVICESPPNTTFISYKLYSLSATFRENQNL